MVLRTFLLITVLLIFVTVNVLTGQADPFVTVEQKLTSITDEEKRVLEELFKVVQEIDLLESEEKKIAQEIKELRQNIDNLKNEIEKEEEVYRKKQEGLAQVLKSYQRMGPASYIEIILNSDSLSSFLRRINIIRDLAHDTGELLEEIENTKNKLTAKKNEMEENLALLEKRNKELSDALSKINELKYDLENRIADLGEEKAFYKDYLENMKEAWTEVKLVFSNVAKDFSNIVRNTNLSYDDLNLSFSLYGVKASVTEEVINSIIHDQPLIENVSIDFQPGKVKIEIPERKLILTGHFAIQEGNVLIFEAEEGSFFDMELEPGSIEELFMDNKMILDLSTILGNDNSIKSVEIKEDIMEILIEWNLFSMSQGRRPA